ncbi:hypothetical protein SK128_024206, partial [Halocaridina rubra]
CISPEDLTCEMIEEIIQYTLAKADTSLPIEISLYYCSGHLSRTLLQQAISQTITRASASLSLVPVLAIEDNHTLLAVNARRH